MRSCSNASTNAGDKRVSAGAVLDCFQQQSLGVSLALLGLITILPIIGDIPGAAIVCATLALLSIIQSLRGTGTLWAPGFVRRRSMQRQKFDRAIGAARPWARRVDRLLKPRLRLLAAGRPQHLMISAVAALLALSMYPRAPGVGLIALGNAFEIMFLSAADLFYDGSIYEAMTEQGRITGLVAMLMTAVLLLGMIRRQRSGPGS